MDAIVIGAGLAGLAAAQRLAAAGRSVVVLEARERAGGRVWTHEGAGVASPVELGAEWVGEGDWHDLLERSDAGLRAARGRRWQRAHNEWEDLGDLPDTNEMLLERIEALRGPDRSLRQALEQCCNGDDLAEARQRLIAYVQGFHAADPDLLSSRWLVEVEATQSAGESELRAANGLARAVDALVASTSPGVELRLGTAARDVRWRRGHVRVTTANGGESIEAGAAIVTVPLSILDLSPDDAGGLRFDPPLNEKRAAAGLLRMGHVQKVVFRFREPFWHAIGPLKKMLFLFAFGSPFPTWWTAIDPALPVLTGWCGGPRASRMPSHGNALVDLALDSLASALGVQRREVDEQLVDTCHHDWSADPFARGAYSYVAVHGLDAHKTLAKPVDDTLYFAGEATCGGGYNGTMEGALQSGYRAADEFLGRAR